MDMSRVEARLLREGFSGNVQRDALLARLTTYRLGGPAALYVEPSDEADLERLAKALAHEPAPLLLIGRGSNLVISDAGWPGVAVRLGAPFSWVREGEAEGDLIAGAATPLPVLANRAARRSLHGLEFMVSIPGSVGGAVRMNAGAHGSDTSRHLATARVMRLAPFRVETRPQGSFDHSYRHSNLDEGEIVLDATFRLAPADESSIKSEMEAYRRHRAETQPGALQNAGSVFKNPSGDSAGRLIEEAGLKGFAVGGAAVSDLHANFFVASAGASAQDVWDLVAAVKARVQQHAGVDLVPEIRFVGVFPARSTEVRV